MIRYIHAIIVGLVQGLTEFLPVSSSGHLVLVQHLLGADTEGLTFEVFVHFGTVLSILWVFRRRLWNIIKSFLALLHRDQWSQFSSSEDRRFGLLLIAGSVPTALIAFLIKDWVDQAFSSLIFVGIALLVTGGLLWVADILPGGTKDINKTSWTDALLIGTFQGIAVFPGLSRSGSTISGALFRGLDKKTAAEFSFLLSIPAVLGATLLEVFALIENGVGLDQDWLYNSLGIAASAGAGILAITFFIKALVKNKLRWFSIYCWIIGIIIIVFL